MLTEALLLDRDLSLRQGQRDVPPPRPGELVVRVEWAGVCAADLRALRTGGSVGYWPATLGHEVAGTVESCPGGELPPGRRVVIDSRVPCGTCSGCAPPGQTLVRGAVFAPRRGVEGGSSPLGQTQPGRCRRLARLGEARPGGFAGHLLVAADRAVACPDGLEAAVAVLAEPLAVARHAVGRVPGPPGRAAILGYGPVGALVHLEITRRWPEARIAVVEAVPARRELASALGAEVTSRDELEDSGRRPEVVIDTAGCPGALALCADGGTVISAARGREPAEIIPDRELTVAGSAGFSGALTGAVAALFSDPERYRPVVTESVLLDEAPDRLRELIGSPSAGKVLIRP